MKTEFDSWTRLDRFESNGVKKTRIRTERIFLNKNFKRKFLSKICKFDS